ncbi:Aste57867_8292 [Aphanomyces stellatus]|uniref:Aste57867_8292 protein n=1 Tax=Aphanomyces stellatus TaxID=120398 RepID=A0A485KJX3_9STRA|nr:hypothetical protein As57867_008261 [Aphanomyces stellatus]VFT85179.1 Aste57867_8292 [Aphanomyces stellatus]
MNLSLDPPLRENTRITIDSNADCIIEINDDGNDSGEANETSITVADLPYNTIAWSYIMGKTWWPVCVCDPKPILNSSKTTDKRSKLARLSKTYALEAEIAAANSDTHCLLYVFGSHSMLLHDTNVASVNATIKAWNSPELINEFPNKEWSRKDDDYGRAMKEVKTFLSVPEEDRKPPYICTLSKQTVTQTSSKHSVRSILPVSVAEVCEEQNHDSMSFESTMPKETGEKVNQALTGIDEAKMNETEIDDAEDNDEAYEPPPDESSDDSEIEEKSDAMSLPGKLVSREPIDQSSQENPSVHFKSVVEPISDSERILGEQTTVHHNEKSQGRVSGDRSKYEPCVSWAQLNNKLWWPVFVCGRSTSSNGAACAETATVQDEYAIHVYFFGRKKFGVVGCKYLKAWKCPEHNTLIYEQPLLDSRSTVVVGAFAGAITEADNFVEVYQKMIREDKLETGAENSGSAKHARETQQHLDEPPKKKQALVELDYAPLTDQLNSISTASVTQNIKSQLVTDFRLLRSCFQPIVPTWKSAFVTRSADNIVKLTAVLQKVLNQLHIILRRIAKHPTGIATPVIFLSVYHAAVMCLWCILFSVSLKKSAQITPPDTQFMHQCIKSVLQAVDGCLKPQIYPTVIQDCVKFAFDVSQMAENGLSVEVGRARIWLHKFLSNYLSGATSNSTTGPSLHQALASEALYFPWALVQELKKIEAIRREFEMNSNLISASSQPKVSTPLRAHLEHQIVPIMKPTVTSHQYGSDTTITFPSGPLGLQVGETAFGVVVVDLSPNAPEQTVRAFRGGEITKGDAIVVVNKALVSKIGYSGFASIVNSDVRPLIVTFRRISKRTESIAKIPQQNSLPKTIDIVDKVVIPQAGDRATMLHESKSPIECETNIMPKATYQKPTNSRLGILQSQLDERVSVVEDNATFVRRSYASASNNLSGNRLEELPRRQRYVTDMFELSTKWIICLVKQVSLDLLVMLHRHGRQ